MSIMTFLGSARRLARDVSGATAIEYALLAAFIAIAIIGSARTVSVQLSNTFSDVAGGFESASD